MTETRKSRTKRPRRRGKRGKKPSEVLRSKGITLRHRYGIVWCPWRPDKSSEPCGNFLAVRSGQQTHKCERCGHRVWLYNLPLVVTANTLKELWAALEESIEIFRSIRRNIERRRPRAKDR